MHRSFLATAGKRGQKSEREATRRGGRSDFLKKASTMEHANITLRWASAVRMPLKISWRLRVLGPAV